MAHPAELAIAGILLGALPGEGPGKSVLVANDATGRIAADLQAQGCSVTTWQRRTFDRKEPSPWPPAGPFAAAIVRLPTARAELEMTLCAVASVTSPGGTIWLYGANDEGIKSAQKPMGALLGDVLTVETRGHCRVLSAVRPTAMAGLKTRLEDWKQTVEIEFGGAQRRFVTYPGCFALGRLDAGTKLLLEHLPILVADASVLDFGCGMGVIAAFAQSIQPGLRLTMLDNDAVALAAARENVPRARHVTSLSEVTAGAVDAILSNPPIHAGKTESHAALAALIGAAPRLLKRGGLMQIVVQRRVGAAALLREAFGAVATIAEDGVFQVLRTTHR